MCPIPQLAYAAVFTNNIGQDKTLSFPAPIGGNHDTR